MAIRFLKVIFALALAFALPTTMAENALQQEIDLIKKEGPCGTIPPTPSATGAPTPVPTPPAPTPDPTPAPAPVPMGVTPVPVHMYWTAGCPYSNRFITTALNFTLSRPGIMQQVMSFHAHPFGNSYFATQSCGSQNGVYDPYARICWEKTCGMGAENRPADCFTGQLINQHGDLEGHMNRLLVCAKASSQGDAAYFMPFVTCIAHAFLEQKPALTSHEEAFGKQCSAEAGLPWGPIETCWKDAPGAYVFGGDLLKKEAMVVPQHPYVPWVIVDGRALQDKLEILSAACAAYKGPKPAGCLGSLTLSEPPFTI